MKHVLHLRALQRVPVSEDAVQVLSHREQSAAAVLGQAQIIRCSHKVGARCKARDTYMRAHADSKGTGTTEQAFRAQPEAFLLRVPPLSPSSLVMANPAEAMRIVFLTDYRLASQAEEPELIDSGVIFAQRFIRQRYPAAARKYCACIGAGRLALLWA